MSYQDKLKHKFNEQPKEDGPVILNKEQSWEFEKRLKEELKTLKERILNEVLNNQGG